MGAAEGFDGRLDVHIRQLAVQHRDGVGLQAQGLGQFGLQELEGFDPFGEEHQAV